MPAAGSTACFQQRPSVANILRRFRENGRAERTLASEGVPMPRLMLMGGIAFLIAGSLSVITGDNAKFGARLLLVFLIPVTSAFFMTLGILNLLKD